ncbi:hypothetical protein Tco_0730536 [Tanacetum coccineum]|uniref:Reverse transcriptase domain-containing protein n=1 Tax=Tanacetum coccineum TaxID=301880 RepID=A0ABQ4YSF4_9ASTR
MEQQPQQDVSRDRLYPPNKQYDFADANKKIDLEKFKFFIDTNEFKFLVEDFRHLFQLPQATNNNHAAFDEAPTFTNMLPFFPDELGYSLLMCLPTHFVTKGLPQPWQTFRKIFARCLTTRVTRIDQPPLNIIFKKIIVDHFLTKNPDISKRLHEHYHRVANDDIVKSVFNSGKNKERLGMRIPEWMLTGEMKLTRHYQLYVSLFRVEVPANQSQPIDSTQGTHRTLCAPWTPNLVITQGESSAPRKPIIIRFRVRSQPDPETLILTFDEIDVTNLDEATQVSIATTRSLRSSAECGKVQEHLVDEEIEKLVDGNDNVDEDEFMDEIFKSLEDPGTRLEPGSHKERPEEEKSVDVLFINDNEEEESARDALIRQKGKGIMEIKDTPPPIPIRSSWTHTAPLSSDKDRLQELMVFDPTPSSSIQTTSLHQNPSQNEVMDLNSSLGKICLGEDVVVILSDKVEGSGDWNSLEFQDTTNKAYDGEINLGVEENMISNEYAVKLCLEHEVKRGNKVVKKELIVALRGEMYFVKFIINLKEDDVEPEVIFGRSFLRLTKAITNFEARTITIYPDIDPFLKETEEEGKSNDDWGHLLDFNIDDIPLLGTSSSAGGHLTQEEAAKESITIGMSQKFALLEEERPIIETMAYNDKYKKMLDEVGKDKVELDGKIVKEEEEAVKRIKGEVGVTTLIAKFLILDILIDRDSPIVAGRGFLCMIGAIVNTPERLFSTFDGFCHQTFRAARSDFMRNAESDSDDEEEYHIKRNKFGAPIYGPKPEPYLTVMIHMSDHWLYKQLKEHTMMRLDHHDPNAQDMKLWKRLAQLLPRHIYLPCVVNWDVLNRMGCDGEIDDMLRIRLREAGSNEEIFTSVAWIRDFNTNKLIYAELCHKFYSTYEFEEVCADDELQTKKIIKFRLGGRAHNLTLLEFARRLGLYQVIVLEEEGFNVYFEGGLRNDDNFNAQDYWLSISREDNLGLSRSHTSTIRNLILRVIHKMITYCLCQRTTGYDKIQKNDSWLLSMFDARHQNGYANGVDRGCGEELDLDTTTLRDLIDSDGKLIPEDPRPVYQELGVFEHMAGVYSVPMQGAYNPPGYAQPQYDKYYQQYPPPPPQYHHKQQDDE